MTTFLAGHAWLPEGVAPDVRIVVDGGRIVAVTARATSQPGDVRLPGLVLPGLANTHSHAFHRALRGRTHGNGGTFWTWRDAMYRVASRLDPDSYRDLASAVYAEMALAGITAVGEFHYLHHRPDGRPYADPNAMGHALMDAARTAGVRLTLLDTAYLAGGIGEPVHASQRRFADADVEAWAERHRRLGDDATTRIGVAIHSVRAVPRVVLPSLVTAARGRPLHVHVSEQTAENEQCRVAYGRTPVQLLAEYGVFGPRTTAVHATHLTSDDVAILGRTGTTVSVCPTTERDLGDGIGPARRLRDAGSPIALGTDQHATIDMFEEARALEMDERLASQQRGRFAPAELVTALTEAGQRSLDWDDAGNLRVGARADLVEVRLDTVRTVGCLPSQAILAAGTSDVRTVMTDGRLIVREGQHELGDVSEMLGRTVAALWT